jgi:oligopeptidase B
MNPKPPVAPKHPLRLTLHGETRDDPYAWLKDPNWQAVMRDPALLDPEIRAYLEAENAYTETVMAPEATLQAALFQEMKGRIKLDDATVPAPDGDYAYYTRYRSGGQHPVFCRRRGLEAGGEQVLLDGDREAEGTSYFRIGDCQQSPDHSRIAYSVDTSGSEYHRLLVKDLASGTVQDTGVEHGRGDVVWANDGETLFYTLLDEQHRPSRVYRHRLGTEAAEDPLVYQESDPGIFVGLHKTESRRFVLISAHDHTTSEVRFIDADRPAEAPRLIAPRQAGVEYDVSDHGERWLIRTNTQEAEDFKIVTTPLEQPGRDNWRDWLAHRPGCYLRALLLFRDFVVRLERQDGLARIVVTDAASRDEHQIAFDEEVYELGLVPGYEYDAASLRFTYSSMTTPQRVYDYNMADRTRVLRKAQEVPSGHDPAAYVAHRLFATSHDGARVPISVLHAKDTPLDGSAPLLLYGYGSYGYAMPADFVTNRLSLVDRGVVYGIAHVRGGTEKGYRWYLDGKLEKKTNSFKDFIAAAETLIESGYTSKGRIAAHGASAGGLLVGAVANLAPELFKAIVAEVPFVDSLNTMCDADLPLTPPEWPEWGNPIADPAAFRRIQAYAPYDNVREQAYPHILATAGLNDPRVTYWEPAKWVARLRACKTDDNLILLKTNMEAGHGGAAGRFDRLEEVALVYAFMLKVFGLADKG